MPCAEGELCQLQDTTPQDPHGHGCQGGCGGRLHGICGSVVDVGNENHRICSACVAKAGKRTVSAADSTGKAQSKRPKATNGGSNKSQPRARPDFSAKCEMLKLMDQKVTHEQIADRFKCSQGHQPHVRDAAELLQKAWASVTAQDIARCFVKAETLPDEMAAELTKQHGKSQFHVAEPTLKALTETLNTLSTSVHEAHKQGTQIEDEDIAELIAELRIEPGKPLLEEAVNAIQGWATIEDDDEVVEALREDTVEDMTAQLAGTRVSTGREEEDEEEDSGDDNTGLARRVPPAYGELSSHFGVLEAAAEESGNGDAALYLAKAKMAMIAAHSKRRVRQADMREFVATE